VQEKQFFTFESQISDKERFKDAEALSVRCMGCEGSFAFESILEDSVSCMGSCNSCQRLVVR
jgi:DNA polymerase alpha subunit A